MSISRTQNVALPVHYHVRWMIRRDMREVLQLEQQEFNPWTEEDFLSALRQRSCIGMVAEMVGPNNNDAVVGYIIYELHKLKLECVKLVADHDNHAVLSSLLRKITSKLSSHRPWVALNVDERSLDLQLLLKSKGWSCVRVIRRGEDDESDSYRFVYNIPAASPVEG